MEHVKVINDCQSITLSQVTIPLSVFCALAAMPIEGARNETTTQSFVSCTGSTLYTTTEAFYYGCGRRQGQKVYGNR